MESGVDSCRNCGKPVLAGDRFCGFCGAATAVPPPIPPPQATPASSVPAAVSVAPATAVHSVPEATQPLPTPVPSSSVQPVGDQVPNPPPPGAVVKTNLQAIASLVLAILWIYGIGSILAIILARSATRQIQASGGAQSGLGFAQAGRILGIIGVVGAILVIVAGSA
jgi:hypothetical protein